MRFAATFVLLAGASSRARSAASQVATCLFAVTRAKRAKTGGPRLSIEERYGTQEGYLCAVKRSADALVRDRFLLRPDADHMIESAGRAAVLPPSGENTPDQRRIADLVCRASS